MQNLVWGLVSPLAGAMADKFGAAKVAAAGAIFYAIGLFTMGAYLAQGLFFGQIMVGIGLGSAGMSIALGAVARATSAEKDRWRWVWLSVSALSGNLRCCR